MAGIKKSLMDTQNDLEMLNNLDTMKTDILDNLMAEQDFRIHLNSIDSNERALNTFCE